jgi:uncharacterized membrane protein
VIKTKTNTSTTDVKCSRLRIVSFRAFGHIATRDCTYETYFRFLTNSHKMTRFTTIVTCKSSISRIHHYSFRDVINLYLILFLFCLALLLSMLLILPRHVLTLIALLCIWCLSIHPLLRNLIEGSPRGWLLSLWWWSDWSLRSNVGG